MKRIIKNSWEEIPKNRYTYFLYKGKLLVTVNANSNRETIHCRQIYPKTSVYDHFFSKDYVNKLPPGIIEILDNKLVEVLFNER